MRRAAKVDVNQREMVALLRSVPGITVEVGHDDILVGHKGKTYWFEVKAPNCVGKTGDIRESAKKESQKKLEKEWRGHYQIVWHVDQIMAELGFTPNTP